MSKYRAGLRTSWVVERPEVFSRNRRGATRFRSLAVGICAMLMAWCLLPASAQLPATIDLRHAPGAEAAPVTRLFGDDSSDVFGSDVHGGIAFGDVNGDGYDDLVVGVPAADTPGGEAAGEIIVYYGSATAKATSLVNFNTDGPVSAAGETRILGEAFEDTLGRTVAVADINGDGYDDIVAGAAVYAAAGVPGRVFVIYGSATLPGTIVDLSNPAGTHGETRIVGPQNGSVFGQAVGTGDIDADGYQDLLIGAPGADTANGADAGLVVVVYGGTGLAGSTIDLADPAGTHGETRILGAAAGDAAGSSVAAGDVNGDGYDDVLVGARGASPGGRTGAGEACVIYGSDALRGTTLDLNTTPGSLGETRVYGDDGPSGNFTDSLGISMACGDFNGDGFADMLVGASGASHASRASAGEAYIVYGAPGLPGQVLDMNTDGAISAAAETRILGGAANDQLGWSVGAADVNGDGLSDALIGIRRFSIGGQPGFGALAVIYGGVSRVGTLIDLRTEAPNVRVIGAKDLDLLGSATAGGGDLDRDGFADFAGSAQFGDNPPLTEIDTGYVALVYGAGTVKTAKATAHFRGGNAPRRGFGDRTAAVLRMWLGFTGGSAAPATVNIHREAVPGSTDRASVYWQVGSTRTGFSKAEITVQYLDSEVQGMNESRLMLYRAASAAGPWTPVPVKSRNTVANTLTSDVETLGYFSLGLDTHAPIATIGPPSVSSTKAGPVSFAVAYTGADAVTLSPQDVQLIKTGTANATVTVSGSGTSLRQVLLSGVTGEGTLAVAVAAGTAINNRGNVAAAAGPSAPVTVSQGRPTLTIGPPSVDVTESDPVSFPVTYSGAGTVSLGPEHVQVVATGTAAATTVTVSGTGTVERLVTLSGIGGNGTLAISITAGSATNVSGSAEGAGPSAVVQVQQIPPAVSIGPPSSNVTASGPVSFTVTYNGASSVTLGASQVSLNATGTATGTVSVSGTGSTARTVTVSGITGNGTLGISVAAGTAVDSAGNAAPGAGPSATFAVDNTPPTVVIGQPSAALTRSGPVSYAITYGGASLVTLAPADVNLVATGTATGTVSVAGTGSTERTVTVSGIAGDGTLSIALAAGTATDVAGNAAPAAGPATAFTVDNTPPAVTIGAPSASATTGGPVTFTVSYAGATTVTLTEAQVTLNRSGTAEGTVSVSGTGTAARTVTVSGITGDGALGISIAAGTATDGAGNTAPGAGPSAAFTVDNTPPTIAIGPPSVSATVNGPVEYLVTYEGATSITLSEGDVILDASGTAAGTVSVSDAGPSARRVALSNITGDGTLAIRIAAGTAVDGVGNSAPDAGPSDLVRVSSGDFAAVIGAPSTSLTRGGPVSFVVTYLHASEILLQASDVDLNATGTATGSVSISEVDAESRRVTISDITGDGTLGISIIEGSAEDGLGNPAPALGPSAVFTVDNTAPTAQITALDPLVGNSPRVRYQVTFSEDVGTTFDAGDVTPTGDFPPGGSPAVHVSRSGATYEVELAFGTGAVNATAGISLGTDVFDAAGNAFGGAASTDTYTIDTAAPTAAVSLLDANPTRLTSLRFQVVFSEEVGSTFTADDVALTGSLAAQAAVAISGDDPEYVVTATLDGAVTTGTLGIAIGAAGVTDAAGNAYAGGASLLYTVDRVPPTVAIGAPSAATTERGPVSFLITYGGASTIALDAAHVQVSATGTAAAAQVAVEGSGAAERRVVLSGTTGNGTLSIALASGTAFDAAGNAAPAAGPSFSVAVVQVPPTVSIGLPSVPVTVTGPVSFTVDYGGAAAVDLRVADIEIVRTGTADLATVAVSGTGIAQRVITLSGLTGTGTLAVVIAPGTAVDDNGNSAPGAGPSVPVTVDGESQYLFGDVNLDGKVNAQDIQMVINAVLGLPVNGRPDVNQDGRVNASDIQLVINVVLGIPVSKD